MKRLLRHGLSGTLTSLLFAASCLAQSQSSSAAKPWQPVLELREAYRTDETAFDRLRADKALRSQLQTLERCLRSLRSAQQEDGRFVAKKHSIDDALATTGVLLTFAKSGSSTRTGKDAQLVTRAVDYLLSLLNENGWCTAAGSDEELSTAEHARVVFALCEALRKSGSKARRQQIERAIRALTARQMPQGGWRHDADEASPYGKDAHAGGTAHAIRALLAARMSGFAVEDTVFDRFVELASHPFDPLADGSLPEPYRDVDNFAFALALIELGIDVPRLHATARSLRLLPKPEELPPRFQRSLYEIPKKNASKAAPRAATSGIDPESFVLGLRLARQAGEDAWKRWSDEPLATIAKLMRSGRARSDVLASSIAARMALATVDEAQLPRAKQSGLDQAARPVGGGRASGHRGLMRHGNRDLTRAIIRGLVSLGKRQAKDGSWSEPSSSKSSLSSLVLLSMLADGSSPREGAFRPHCRAAARYLLDVVRNEDETKTLSAREQALLCLGLLECDLVGGSATALAAGKLALDRLFALQSPAGFWEGDGSPEARYIATARVAIAVGIARACKIEIPKERWQRTKRAVFELLGKAQGSDALGILFFAALGMDPRAASEHRDSVAKSLRAGLPAWREEGHNDARLWALHSLYQIGGSAWRDIGIPAIAERAQWIEINLEKASISQIAYAVLEVMTYYRYGRVLR